MRPDELRTIGIQAEIKCPTPQGRYAVLRAFEIGKRAAANAIYEALMKEQVAKDSTCRGKIRP